MITQLIKNNDSTDYYYYCTLIYENKLTPAKDEWRALSDESCCCQMGSLTVLWKCSICFSFKRFREAMVNFLCTFFHVGCAETELRTIVHVTAPPLTNHFNPITMFVTSSPPHKCTKPTLGQLWHVVVFPCRCESMKLFKIRLKTMFVHKKV